MDNKQTAGLLFFIGAIQFFLGMLIAESLYPGYSISGNYISDLGATCRETCVVQEPSAAIFNISVFLFGLSVAGGAYLVSRASKGYLLPALFALAGIGAMGVGIFPETSIELHMLFSLVAFLFGGLSAIASYKLVKAPFNYISVIMGAASLVALVVFATGEYLGLGPGGMERVIAYFSLLWVTGFGGCLMASEKKKSS
jgi:hypothetical membrane protein